MKKKKKKNIYFLQCLHQTLDGSVRPTHRELRQAVQAVQLAGGGGRRLLSGRLAVQVVARQSFHRAHALPDPSLHLLLVDGQIQVLPLEAKRGVVNLDWIRSTLKPRKDICLVTDLHRDDAAGLVVVRPAEAVAVQRVQQRVGLITEGLAPHRTEVKVEAVHQEVNFDPGPPGLGTHGRGGTGDECGAVDRAESLKLQMSEKSCRDVFHGIL